MLSMSSKGSATGRSHGLVAAIAVFFPVMRNRSAGPVCLECPSRLYASGRREGIFRTGLRIRVRTLFVLKRLDVAVRQGVRRPTVVDEQGRPRQRSRLNPLQAAARHTWYRRVVERALDLRRAD